MGRLDGKVVLISGGARGQGEAEAKLFVREGARVAVADVLDDDAKRVAAALGDRAIALHLDVTQESEWIRAVAATVAKFGKLTTLVNNAGILRMEGIEETTLEVWNRVIAVNQTGVWLGMKHAIPELRKAGGGTIVNISSIAGLVGVGAAAAYQSTKGAVRILTKTAAVQYAREGIRVNSIHPGVITTAMVTEGIALESRKMFEQATPLGREGSAEEMAYGALFLVSDESSYMTGAELVLDGGYTAQ